MSPDHRSIRDVSDDLWRRLRIEALRQGLRAGELLARYIEEGLASDDAVRNKEGWVARTDAQG